MDSTNNIYPFFLVIKPKKCVFTVKMQSQNFRHGFAISERLLSFANFDSNVHYFEIKYEIQIISGTTDIYKGLLMV